MKMQHLFRATTSMVATAIALSAGVARRGAHTGQRTRCGQRVKLEFGTDAGGIEDMAEVAAQAVADVGRRAGYAAQREAEREPRRRTLEPLAHAL